MSKLYAVKITEDNRRELTSWILSHKDFDEDYLPIEGHVTQDARGDNSYQIWNKDLSDYPEYIVVTLEEFLKKE